MHAALSLLLLHEDLLSSRYGPSSYSEMLARVESLLILLTVSKIETSLGLIVLMRTCTATSLVHGAPPQLSGGMIGEQPAS